MSGKTKFTFNGKEIEAAPGVPLLQAAIEAKIEVPHFCYHPAIGVEGSCRLCLVEIAGMPKLQTSCTVPVKEGLVVSSVSEPVKKARKGVLEFFLLNHPLDCPICDKGGECPLQNYSLDAGQAESRLGFEKIHKEKHRVIGEHIVLDKERCVLCNRCVRFSRDFTGREELQIKNRGAHSEIFVPEGTMLTSGFTGNLADMCPVGALTSREYRFKARPWETTTIDTTCGECSLGCSVQTWRKKNEVLRMTPRVEPQVNEWWLCDRGRYSVKPRLSGERITLPTKAANGVDLSAPEGVAKALAAELRSVPRGAFAFVADSSLTNEEFFTAKQLAKKVGGRIFVPPTPALREALKNIQELGLELKFPIDLETSQSVFVLGERLEEDHPVLALRLRKMVHMRKIELFTAGKGDLGFNDIVNHNDPVSDSDDIKTFLNKNGEKVGPGAAIFLSDRWLNEDTQNSILSWLKKLADRKDVKIGLLVGGANDRGMLDQWDETVRSIAELETEIQRGRVEGILWYGQAPAREIFSEYARGMRMFAQFVSRKEDAHPRARWILPRETFFEKTGTYTNTFGKVQTLRRSTRIVSKGYELGSVLAAIAAALGENVVSDWEHIYREVAQQIGHYPKSSEAIPESKETYQHYERALWR